MIELGYLFIGVYIGAMTMWLYFALNRRLRTEEEYYSDPVIQRRHPKESFQFFVEEDEADEDFEEWTETMLHGPRF